MIQIKTYNNKWQIEIKDEKWQAKDIDILKRVLEQLLTMKDTYQIKKEED